MVVFRSEQAVSTIFPPYIMPNGTYERIKKFSDTLPLMQSLNYVIYYFLHHMYEKRSSDCENKDAYSKVLLCASSKHATRYLHLQALAPHLENGQHYYIDPTSQEPFSRKKSFNSIYQL